MNLTPSVLARLDDMRARRRWTRSTAAAVLIEHGLDSEDRMTALAGQATTSQEYTALTQENLGDGGKGDDRYLRSGTGRAATRDAP